MLSVSPHTYEFKADPAELDVQVKVEDVLREGTQTSGLTEDDQGESTCETPIRVGDTVTFCLSKSKGNNLDLKQYINSLKGKTQVWAFSTWPRSNNGDRLYFEIEQHFEPFHNQGFSTRDLKELAADLTKVITDPQEAKRSIEKYLKERWTENRIRNFCHKDNFLVGWGPVPDPDWIGSNGCEDSTVEGILYPKSTLGKVAWIAYTTNKTPTSYGLVVKRGNCVWQLERSNFELCSSFADDDALKVRLQDTLKYATQKAFDAHLRPALTKEEASREGVFSTSPLHFPPDWRTFTIEREDHTRKVVAVSYATSSGRLRALLNGNKEIQTVTVNGKQDNDWMEALSASNEERSKLYMH